MPPCRVIRNTITGDIIRVTTDIPFNKDRRDLLVRYMSEKLGQNVVMDAQKMSQRLLDLGVDTVNYSVRIPQGNAVLQDRFNPEGETINTNIQNSVDFLSTPQGEVYGFVDTEGTIYIDPHKAGEKTLIHEGSHVYYKILENLAPQDAVVNSVLNQIKTITEPIVDKIFNYKKGLTLTQTEGDFQIIGEQGASRLEDYNTLLEEAKKLSNEGVDFVEIEKRTGWYKLYGQWRMMLPEAVEQFKIQVNEANTEYGIKQVLGEENILFESYPEMEEIKIVFVDVNKNNKPQNLPKGFEDSGGAYVENIQTIYINKSGTKNDKEIQERNLAHEVAHVIQKYEGFPKGGDIDSLIYESLDILGIDYADKTISEIEGEIKSSNKDSLTPNEQRIVNASLNTLSYLKTGRYGDMREQYKRFLGEVDANVVIDALKDRDLGITEFSYLTLFAKYLVGERINLNELYLLRNGTIRFNNRTSEENVSNIFSGEVRRDGREPSDTEILDRSNRDSFYNNSLIEGNTGIYFNAQLSSPLYNQRPNESDEQYRNRLTDEIFARLQGENAEAYLDSLGFTKKEAKSFIGRIAEFIEQFTNWLKGKRGFQHMTVEEISQMSIREFLDTAMTSQLLGEFGSIIRTDVQGRTIQGEIIDTTSDNILSYPSETGDINYYIDPETNDMQMLSEVEFYKPQVDSMTYKQLQSIPGVTQEEALEMYKHLYTPQHSAWRKEDILNCNF